MRKIAWLWLVFASAAFAQMSVPSESVAEQLVVVSDTTIYAVKDVDVKPQFPGGEEAIYRWLAENMNYPASTVDIRGSFRIIAQFEISGAGKIENIEIIQGCRFTPLDREVVHLIESMPDWTPGYVNGMPVRVKYILPIIFRSEEYEARD